MTKKSTAPTGRLTGKVALITGATGNLGGVTARHFLREGATVVLSGRDPAKLDAARRSALADTGCPDDRASTVAMDGADPQQVRDGINELIKRHGRLDVIINNAGSAGPRQPLAQVPLNRTELDALRAAGAKDTETLGDAARNILGVTWNVVRAAAPHLQPGASIVNISTIFSRTQYYGRTAYVVPKAALNALSRELSIELGAQGIRVNTLFPGPINSERIRSVFATMDQLRGDAQGTTANDFFNLMSLKRSFAGSTPEKTFPVPDDVAHTCVFLASDESAAFNGHDFEVTHGMYVRKESRSTWVSRPTLRVVDAAGLTAVVFAGDEIDDALGIARMQAAAGAEVIIAFALEDQVRAAREQLGSSRPDSHITLAQVDRHDPAAVTRLLERGKPGSATISGAIILPSFRPADWQGTLATASDAEVDAFVDTEICGAITLARCLNHFWADKSALAHAPRVVFVTNGHDGKGNAWSNCLRAAMEELIRVWRDETDVDVKHGRRHEVIWSNQIIRYDNTEAENVPFAGGQAARLLFTERRIRQVNLYLPLSIVEATGARRSMLGFTENLTGLHLGKVALITGGSAGIGGQVARLLALGGARVMLVARRESELDNARARIVGELEDVGYSGAHRRVQTLAGINVGDLASLPQAVEHTIKTFGRIDYLINNAGIAGAEDMVVDMAIDDWRYTLDANLVSNYALMHAVVPMMRRQGSGYILNVSSYFGGEKYLAVAYPNRADYAVSKAGQRAMAESMARFLGPEIQINAIAPGPVEGERLAGTVGRPGLFERRGRLILENRRLNAIHDACVRAMRRGLRAEALLASLAPNDTKALAADLDAPHELRELAARCQADGTDDCTWGSFLMNEDIAKRLASRLRLSGYFLDSPDWGDRSDSGWLQRLPPDDVRFLPQAVILREAQKIKGGVLSLLHLKKMPKETEVALATVFFLADRAVSGETFMPSGGLNLERSITERELFGSTKKERIEMMRGRTVWLIGEHLVPHLVESTRQLVLQCHVAKVLLITRTQAGADALMAGLKDLPPGSVDTCVCGGDIEAGIDTALRVARHPTTIVSTPFVPLPDTLFGGPDEPSLDAAGFRELVDANLTHHFRVARKASLIDGAQLVLVSPDVPPGSGSDGAAFGLANFVKTTMHAFTATLAVENERLVHDVPVNQINLTRRVRSEEPRNDEERMEEVKRFARAVLLAGAPLPDAEDSRYRSRIYRGQAITV